MKHKDPKMVKAGKKAWATRRMKASGVGRLTLREVHSKRNPMNKDPKRVAAAHKAWRTMRRNRGY
jgi:molybdenum cofactor biosynthesis enzyme